MAVRLGVVRELYPTTLPKLFNVFLLSLSPWLLDKALVVLALGALAVGYQQRRAAGRR